MLICPDSYHVIDGYGFQCAGFNELTRPRNTVGASRRTGRRDPHGISGSVWTRRSLRQRTSATCARSSRQASSAPRSSGTTSSSTAPPPRWSSASCSSRTPSPLIGTLAGVRARIAVGFAARPLGGVVFGHFGDRVGRKSMLVTVADHHGPRDVPDRLPADVRVDRRRWPRSCSCCCASRRASASAASGAARC